MNDTFQCGDPGALVGYLYDECDPGERELIAAHITRCATCASEIDTLGATRRTLTAWTPPDLALGFQITRPHDVGPAANQPARLEPTIAWWRAPLPAWAQAAAAVVIFAAGLSLGVARSDSSGQSASLGAGVAPSASRASATNVSREELAQLEQRLRAEMSQMRMVSSVAAAPAPARGADALMTEIRALIAQSNEEQNRDFTLRLVDLASSVETQRRMDMASVRQSIGQQSGVIGTELRQYREAIDQIDRRTNNMLINASERSR
jgi:anti-sigma factor RsiW